MDQKEFLPPLEFGSLVLPFYTQAMIKLGAVEDLGNGEYAASPELAKRLIDLLDLLKDRTKGNLEEDEEKFLEACLSQLKIHYLQSIERLKM